MFFKPNLTLKANYRYTNGYLWYWNQNNNILTTKTWWFLLLLLSGFFRVWLIPLAYVCCWYLATPRPSVTRCDFFQNFPRLDSWLMFSIVVGLPDVYVCIGFRISDAGNNNSSFINTNCVDKNIAVCCISQSKESRWDIASLLYSIIYSDEERDDCFGF